MDDVGFLSEPFVFRWGEVEGTRENQQGHF